ncbi:MAG: ribonuclease HI [Cyclobacteriaceae bacterium]|jgi:ribonuclease HI|nr:ribonuclease HI [Cyclobacteriaceae bacterium]MDH4297996.1 ribonuclease HI [Cyclobacteriaceae bacterium]MDH5249992.1 ribonuclease HI [Cyclobacteriaceae bacterium]
MDKQNDITIYTDGSCNPLHKIGGWAAILLIDDKKVILKGKELNTTNQRMELIAVLESLAYLRKNSLLANPITICSDSQYVVNIQKRSTNLTANNLLTGKGQSIRNADLVKKLIDHFASGLIKFTKVVAHQKVLHNENHNREADKIARRIVRDHFR